MVEGVKGFRGFRVSGTEPGHLVSRVGFGVHGLRFRV